MKYARIRKRSGGSDELDTQTIVESSARRCRAQHHGVRDARGGDNFQQGGKQPRERDDDSGAGQGVVQPLTTSRRASSTRSPCGSSAAKLHCTSVQSAGVSQLGDRRALGRWNGDDPSSLSSFASSLVRARAWLMEQQSRQVGVEAQVLAQAGTLLQAAARRLIARRRRQQLMEERVVACAITLQAAWRRQVSQRWVGIVRAGSAWARELRRAAARKRLARREAEERERRAARAAMAADRVKASVRLQAAGRRMLARRQLRRLRAERPRARTERTGEGEDASLQAMELLFEGHRRLADEISELRRALAAAVCQTTETTSNFNTALATLTAGLAIVARDVRRMKSHGETSGPSLRSKRSCISRDATVATADAHTSTAVSGSSLAQLVATLASPRWQRANEPASRRSGGRQRRQTRQARRRQTGAFYFE